MQVQVVDALFSRQLIALVDRLIQALPRVSFSAYIVSGFQFENETDKRVSLSPGIAIIGTSLIIVPDSVVIAKPNSDRFQIVLNSGGRILVQPVGLIHTNEIRLWNLDTRCKPCKTLQYETWFWSDHIRTVALDSLSQYVITEKIQTAQDPVPAGTSFEVYKNGLYLTKGIDYKVEDGRLVFTRYISDLSYEIVEFTKQCLLESSLGDLYTFRTVIYSLQSKSIIKTVAYTVQRQSLIL